MVANTGKVLYTTATDQHYAVLLQVMADTRNVSGSLDAVGKPYSCYFTQRGVGLLGGRGTDRGSNTTLLGRILIGHYTLLGIPALQQCRRGRLLLYGFSALANQLVKGWHGCPPFIKKYLFMDTNPEGFRVVLA